MTGLAASEPESLNNLAENYWAVTSVGGEETILVVAAVRPLPELDRALESVPRAGSLQAVPLEIESVASTLRGVGGLTPEPGASETAVDAFTLSALSQELLAIGNEDIRVWEIRLRNPS